MHITLHPADSRGKAELDWLSTRYSFSFAHWHDPSRMGFGKLRVLNNDTIAPQSGFPMHSHENMEIITIVTEGAVTHSDSMGNTDIQIKAGEVQIMSTGTGVTHAEYNAENTPLKLFQLWIEPSHLGGTPRYEQHAFSWQDSTGITPLVGPINSDYPLHMQQDGYLSIANSKADPLQTYTLHNSAHGVYIFVIDGSVTIAGNTLNTRDAAALSDTEEISITHHTQSTLLLVEIPLY